MYYKNEFQPFLILLLIFCGGILAFLMEMSGNFFLFITYLFLEYLLLVYTSGITLSILGIVKVNLFLLF